MLLQTFCIDFRNLEDYQEFHYSIKIPIRLLKDGKAEVLKYKYHVESSATINGLICSLEFIVGPKSYVGIIDRFLTVQYIGTPLKARCKCLYNICLCVMGKILGTILLCLFCGLF